MYGRGNMVMRMRLAVGLLIGFLVLISLPILVETWDTLWNERRPGVSAASLAAFDSDGPREARLTALVRVPHSE